MLGDMTNITKKEIVALLLVCYLVGEEEKRKKYSLVAMLNNNIAIYPSQVAVETTALPSL